MKILVVEDEHRISSFICRGLEEEGYSVDVREDGEAALEALKERPYDVVVLDIMLPRLDGLSVLRRLRESGDGVPVLLLTARDAIENRIEGLDSGADYYLTKPFSFDEFLACLRALLRRPSASGGAVLRVGDLLLDPATKHVRRGDRPLRLSPREFALLEYFMRHPRAVLSRTRIFSHVWDGTYDGVSNVVDVYVTYLRRKLENGEERRILHTVRGQGYVLRGCEED